MGIRDRSIMGLFMDSIISPLDLKYRNKSIQGILINMKSSGLVVQSSYVIDFYLENVRTNSDYQDHNFRFMWNLIYDV